MRALLLILALLLPLAAQAQIYRWTDEQGRTRYGERPPPGVKARLVASPSQGAAPASPPGRNLEEEEAAFRRRQIEQRQAEEQQAAATKNREQHCDSLRQQLVLAGQARLFRVEKGERIYYTDAEKEAHAARLRALIRERCP